MTKLLATGHAQIVIDKAVQLFGGASDVQKVIIARQALECSKGEN